MNAAIVTRACGNCRWWALSRHAAAGEAARGQCRRHAPRGPAPDLQSPAFPSTAPEQWCGDHTPISPTWPDRLAEMEKEEGA